MSLVSNTVQPIDVILFGLWCAVTIYYSYQAVREWLTVNRLKTRGELIQGTVSNKEERQSRGSRNRRVMDYWITYQYAYGVQRFQQSQQIGKTHYDQLSTGQSVEVLCLPNDPRFSILGGKDQDNSKLNRLLVIVALCVGLFLFLAASLLSARR